MFSTGQIIFGIIFFIGFVIVIAWTYRKDIPLHKIYYKGSHWVLIGFIAFVLLLLLIKQLIYS